MSAPGRHRDPLEVFAAQNPAPPEEYAGLGEGALAELAIQRVLASAAPVARRRWWRRRRIVVPAIAIVALGSAAAGYELTRPVTSPLSVGCYAAPSRTALAVVVPSGTSATATCRPLWSNGTLGGGGGVPPLYACVLPSGAVGVFPSRDGTPCARLGLAQPAPATGATGRAIRLRETLVHDEATSRGCLSAGEARRDAHDAFAMLGLSGWHTVVQPGYSAAQHCSGYGIDVAGRTVYVVPQART